LSPEAPVPVMEYIRTETAEGMASNVRANLLSFGVNVYLMTNELKPVKTRFVDERSNQQLMRMDENDEVADYGWELPTSDYYPTGTVHHEPIGEPFDAMIISDYDKGFLDTEKIFEMVEAFDGPVFIDSKKTKLPKKGCFIKINELEDSKLKGIYRNKIVTKGSAGAEYKGKIYPGEKVPCFDVAGAGDTFLCALVYFYLEYGTIEKAIPYANKAASIAVQNTGTYVLTGDDIDDIRS
tara:strand:+ start:16492 stop:17205 length:714 start_codon:yes stop_codon:yes gene_type:complete